MFLVDTSQLGTWTLRVVVRSTAGRAGRLQRLVLGLESLHRALKMISGSPIYVRLENHHTVLYHTTRYTILQHIPYYNIHHSILYHTTDYGCILATQSVEVLRISIPSSPSGPSG